MAEEEGFGSFFGDLMQQKHGGGEAGYGGENIGKILKKKKVRGGGMSDRRGDESLTK